MKRSITIARIDDIPIRGARTYEAEGMRIAVFRTFDDRIYAIEDRCPHRGGPLSMGIVHGGKVTCPLHDWTIELSSGSVVGPDPGCVRTFPVSVNGDEIVISLEKSGVIHACAG